MAVTPQAGAALSDFVRSFIEEFLAVPENNNLGPLTAGKAWDGFLLGFSSGADELYSFLKHHIGEFHWTPAEAFALAAAEDPLAAGAAPTDGRAPNAGSAGQAMLAPDELTVISWAVCQTEEAKAANRQQTRFPSEPWARSRIYGQRCNRALHRALVEALVAQGHPAMAPGLLSQFGDRQSRTYGQASNWSERHVAFISGLGTFSLAGGLITEQGQAVRLGSVVVRAQIPPTRRPYTDPFEYCLFYTHGSCSACVDRCPVGSVTEERRDKRACARHLEPATAEYVMREYGFDGYGCGLCQTDVPCESGIPEPPRRPARS
jgi:epoxyqueuosine reductase